MPIMLNTILRDAGLSLADVRLLRHKHRAAPKGRTPYEPWRDNRPQFEWYQQTQSIRNRKKLNAPYWAAFVVNPSDETMFAALYAAIGLAPRQHLNKKEKVVYLTPEYRPIWPFS